MPPAKIHDHAVIGDGRSVALVTRAGDIDWLCWPRFESTPLFGALLDDTRGGRWRIAPREPAHGERAYVDGTNVLATRFATASGAIVVTDLMPVASEVDKRRMLVPDHELLRRVACERGEVEVELDCEPRPGFGRLKMRIEHGALGVRWHIGTRLVTLRGTVPLALADGRARATFTLRAGEAATFSLTYDEESPAVLPPLELAEASIARSVAWWRGWTRGLHYGGPYRDAVERSALTLKLMSFAPSGAIVAAPTTSLPERFGGDLNWDYRFCWLRDAAFTARALLGLGYVDDATAYCSWLLHTTRLTRPELRNVYDVYGNPPPPERTLAIARGYYDARPVRAGIAINSQLQLDTYGEVIDAAAMVARTVGTLDRETRHLLRDFGGYVCAHWRDADSGIWEPREPVRHRTHSRLLCWVALDRLLDLVDRGLLDRVDRDELGRHRAAIRDDIERRAWDPAQQSYTGTFGDPELDASTLLMSWYGFHAPGDARMRSTYAAIARALDAGPGLLYRYERSIAKREGAFWICSFWAAEHLALGGGTIAEATAMFEAARSYANDVGLMAEEVDPHTHDALGNFPQAYTHVGLINTALTLEERAVKARAA